MRISRAWNNKHNYIDFRKQSYIIMKMKSVALVIALLLCGAAFAFAQQESASPIQEAAQEEAAPVVSSEKQSTITAIEVRGNKAISTNSIVSKMKTRVGSPYQEAVASDDLKRLYLLGFFSDIKIDTEEYKDGKKIIVTVVERPLIEKIVFSGMRHITLADEKLKGQLKSKEAQYLDYPSLAEDVRTLTKMYEKKGYVDAKVDYQVDISPETKKAKIQFSAVEGKKSRIKNILIKGNSAFSSSRILRLLKTKRAWLFNAGVLKEDVLSEDMERVKAFYHKNGYSDVALDFRLERDTKRAFLMYIVITIEEGKKYLVGNIVLVGNKDVAEKDILATLTECVPGKVFSQEALKADVANIQGAYFDRGYISANVQEATSVNPYTSRVDIQYTVTENQVSYVNKIKIKGNVKTRDVVIRRELRIHPGERFDGDKLKRSKERLQNLGFFEEVSYDTEDTDSTDKKDLVVEVKESKTGAFSFGGGFSTVEQFIGFVEIEQKNFDWRNFPYFTGAGQNLKLRASMGTISSGYELSFTEPWLFDYPISFGFDAYRRTYNREEDLGYGYDEDITGGSLRLGKELTELVRADLVYRFDRIEISNIPDDASTDLKQEEGNNQISSITPGIVFDSRDNVFDPSKGSVLSGSFEWAGGTLGGDKDFWKFFSRASHYFSLPKKSTLEVRGRAGITEAYADSERVPIYERFFAGGANTIRGYPERSIGPIDSATEDPLGGDALLVGNVEYLYPLFSMMKVALFYDIGNVWSNASDFATGDLLSSFGFGLRLKTPIGPIVLDYGIPLDDAPGDENKGKGRFHFSVSHGF